MRVTIVGPGNMGRGIATRLLAGGHSVALVGHDRKQAEETASGLRAAAATGATVEAADLEQAIAGSEAVVLALPYQASLDFARQHGRLLGGKTVIDISNPLNETYTGLVTEGGASAAETIRALLPPDAPVVKAFNTTFASTLMAGDVAGQPLDVFIAGDDRTANGRVAELVRHGGMRPIAVGGLERARQLEALGFLGISIQDPLGTGYMSGWKLVFPGTQGRGERGRFPRNAVVGALSDTSAMNQIVTALAAIGIEPSSVHLVFGPEGAARLRSAKQESDSTLAFLWGFESEHTQRHLQEVEGGHPVVVVEVEDGTMGDRVGELLVSHGGHFVNYYSRWTSRIIAP